MTALMVTTFMAALARVKNALAKGTAAEPMDGPPFTTDWIFAPKYD
jgi:hypothetical protein